MLRALEGTGYGTTSKLVLVELGLEHCIFWRFTGTQSCLVLEVKVNNLTIIKYIDHAQATLMLTSYFSVLIFLCIVSTWAEFRNIS